MDAPRPRPLSRIPRWVIYWSAQLLGWGLYFGLSMVASYLDGSYDPRMWDVLLPELLTGIGISHALRAVIIRRRWLEQPIGMVLPRIMLASVVMGLAAFLIESVLISFALDGLEAVLGRMPLEHMGRVVNWSALLAVWSFLYFAYGYFMRHRREEIRNLRLEAASRENQLNTLRAQMNPHFMFNALNGIRALIDEDPARAKRSITQLSNILRNSMMTVRRNTVPLGEELDIVKAYLELEAMRFEERLRVRFDVEEGMDRLPVPPMMLQTLAENAVRHGIANLTAGGDLEVGVHRTLDGLLLSVKNSGTYDPHAPERTGTPSNGIGLENTRKRLEMLYGRKAELRIENRDGMVVTEVEIPIAAGKSIEFTPPERNTNEP